MHNCIANFTFIKTYKKTPPDSVLYGLFLHVFDLTRFENQKFQLFCPFLFHLVRFKITQKNKITHSWQTVFDHKNHVGPNTNEYSNIFTLAHKVGGKGFGHSVTLMNCWFIRECWFIRKQWWWWRGRCTYCKFLFTKDFKDFQIKLYTVKNVPNVEGAAQFHRELISCMDLYKEVAPFGQQRHNSIRWITIKNIDAERRRQQLNVRVCVNIITFFEKLVCFIIYVSTKSKTLSLTNKIISYLIMRLCSCYWKLPNSPM